MKADGGKRLLVTLKISALNALSWPQPLKNPTPAGCIWRWIKLSVG